MRYYLRVSIRRGNLDQRASKVFIARHGRSELTTTIFTATEIRDLVERMLKSSGRRIDLSAPFVAARTSTHQL
jgi:Flp pilus assembly CpaF family ATPase